MIIQMEMPILGTYIEDEKLGLDADSVRPVPLPFDNVGILCELLERHFEDGYGIYEYTLEIITTDLKGFVARSQADVPAVEAQIRAFANLPLQAKENASRDAGRVRPNERFIKKATREDANG
jgi:hypothetical protein